MSSPKKLRLNQRQRTRAALVQAAMEALTRGQTPTVEAAAEAARVSRATAYRYFPSQHSLLFETSLEGLGTGDDLRRLDSGSVESRVDSAIRAQARIAQEHEFQLRTFLMMSQEQWLNSRKKDGADYPVRKGRRLIWIDRALAAAQSLSPRRQRRLRTALALLCGIEALVVARDVCQCTPREAEDVSRWAAQALLRAALEESRP